MYDVYVQTRNEKQEALKRRILKELPQNTHTHTQNWRKPESSLKQNALLKYNFIYLPYPNN